MGAFARAWPVLLPGLLLLVTGLLIERRPALINLYSDRDRDLMIRIAIWESRHEPYTGKVGVAWVIKNRWKSAAYGWQTIADVVTACGKVRRKGRLIEVCQFEPWQAHRRDLLAIPATALEYKKMAIIVDGVLSGRIGDPTNGAFYFLNIPVVKKRNKGRLPRAWQRIVANPQCCKIGRHSFCPR